MRAESVFGMTMTMTHGDVRRFRVGGLCDDRFETAPPRQGADECRMAAEIWVEQCRVLHGGSLEVARLGAGVFFIFPLRFFHFS